VSSTRKATITDVARLANVSIQTVSAVVNRKPGISDPTRNRVLHAIEQDCQQPARPKESDDRSRYSDHHQSLLSRIRSRRRGCSQRKGFSIFLCNADEDTEKEIQYLRLLQRHRVAGILVSYVSSPATSESVLAELASHHLPIACLGRAQPGQGIVSLRVNESEITRIAAQHLIKLGHRRIGFITPPPSKNIAQMRIEGFKRALVEADLPVRPEYLVDGGFDLQDGVRGAGKLLSLRYPPTAVVAANDLVAIGVISTLKKQGRRIPADISVVGIDDIPMASLLDPPLTTVSQPIYEMGRLGMENILLRIQNPQLDTSEIVFETRLIIRQSTVRRLATKSKLTSCTP
jgi:DNA-binding LacI/PurR family transcriptional regulator